MNFTMDAADMIAPLKPPAEGTSAAPTPTPSCGCSVTGSRSSGPRWRTEAGPTAHERGWTRSTRRFGSAIGPGSRRFAGRRALRTTRAPSRTTAPSAPRESRRRLPSGSRDTFQSGSSATVLGAPCWRWPGRSWTRPADVAHDEGAGAPLRPTGAPRDAGEGPRRCWVPALCGDGRAPLGTQGRLPGLDPASAPVPAASPRAQGQVGVRAGARGVRAPSGAVGVGTWQELGGTTACQGRLPADGRHARMETAPRADQAMRGGGG